MVLVLPYTVRGAFRSSRPGVELVQQPGESRDVPELRGGDHHRRRGGLARGGRLPVAVRGECQIQRVLDGGRDGSGVSASGQECTLVWEV